MVSVSLSCLSSCPDSVMDCYLEVETRQTLSSQAALLALVSVKAAGEETRTNLVCMGNPKQTNMFSIATIPV